MSLSSGVKLHTREIWLFDLFFPQFCTSDTVRQGTDISKCFREFLGLLDKESRRYMYMYHNTESTDGVAVSTF